VTTVKYGRPSATDTAGEPQWVDSATFTFAEDDKLYVKIIPSDTTEAPWYYGVHISRILSSDATLTGFTVGGVAATLSTPGNLGGFGSFEGTAGTVTLTSAQAGDGSNVQVLAALPNGATVRYAWGGNFYGSYYPSGNWQTSGAGLFNGGTISLFNGAFNIPVTPGVNGAVIFIEVTSENGGIVNLYAISCQVQ
jgi:hypothetical protein